MIIANGEGIIFLILLGIIIAGIIGVVKFFELLSTSHKLLKQSRDLEIKLQETTRMLERVLQKETPPPPVTPKEIIREPVKLEPEPVKSLDAVIDKLATPEKTKTPPAEPEHKKSLDAIINQLAPPEKQKEPTVKAEPVKLEPKEVIELKPPMPIETPKPASVDWESVIGRRWLTWVGVAVLFFSAVFFIKYAFDNNYIGPKGQILVGALAGIGIIVLGSRLIQKKMRALGQGLLGLGLAVLYVTFTAASSIYTPEVLSNKVSFVLLIMVTIAGMTLAVLYNALPIAIIALLGGLLTPVLVSTGSNSRDVLFAYITLLNLGVLGVSLFRRWRPLDTIAVIGSYILYSGWFERHYGSDQLIPAMVWLGVLYLVFMAIAFTGNLIRKIKLTPGRFILALGNILLASGFAGYMLHKEHQSVLALLSLVNSTLFLGLSYLFYKKLPKDTAALSGFYALAISFLTISVPLYFGARGITLAWAVEAPVLLYLGYKFSHKGVRYLSLAILGLAGLHLLGNYIPLHKELYRPFFNSRFLTVISVPLAAAACALLHNHFKKLANDIDHSLKVFVALAGGLLAMFLVGSEASGYFRIQGDKTFAVQISVLVWTISAGIYLAGAYRWRNLPAWSVGCFVVFLASINYLRIIPESRVLNTWLFFNIRFIPGLLLLVLIMLYGLVIGKKSLSAQKPSKDILILTSVISIFCGWLLFSNEVYTYSDQVLGWSDRDSQFSLSIMWGIYAAAMLVVGFWKHIRNLRYAAIALFAISAGKLFLVDIRMAKGIIRIVAFMSLGVLLLLGSYLYHKLEKTLSPQDKLKESEIKDE